MAISNVLKIKPEKIRTFLFAILLHQDYENFFVDKCKNNGIELIYGKKIPEHIRTDAERMILFDNKKNYI